MTAPVRTTRKSASTDKNDIRNWEDARAVDPDKLIVPDEEEGSKLREVPPQVPRPSLKQGVGKAIQRLRETPTKTRPRTPKPNRPRSSVEKLIGTAWQMLAQVAQPINLPVARVLDMQAPVAGMILEDAVKNTVVDRILQPIARVEAGGEVAFALMGPPLIVGALTARPAMAPVLVPMLRASLRTWIDVAGPKLEAVEKKEAEFEERYGARIDTMIQYFLSPPPEPDINAAGPQ